MDIRYNRMKKWKNSTLPACSTNSEKINFILKCKPLSNIPAILEDDVN